MLFQKTASKTIECAVLLKAEIEKKFFVGSVIVITTAVLVVVVIGWVFASALVFTGEF